MHSKSSLCSLYMRLLPIWTILRAIPRQTMSALAGVLPDAGKEQKKHRTIVIIQTLISSPFKS